MREDLGKEWIVKQADNNEHLALIVLMLEEAGYDIKTINWENRVVLAKKQGKERLDD